MRIKSQKDFRAGLLYVVIGVGFAWGATSYTIGDSARMGPGFFPLMLGVVLAIIGAVVTFGALVFETPDGDPVGSFAWRPMLLIILSNMLFGILLGGIPTFGVPAMGLIAAIYGLTFVAAAAGDEFDFKEVLILATILAVGSYLTFVYGLQLQFQVWPSFISG